ncbi:MAG: hypothetical protein RID07_06305 [Lacipirellulaceae bacterium]
MLTQIFEERRPITILLSSLSCLIVITCGCDSGPEIAPATGKVYYNDQPLPFGSVMFQPAKGQPATGKIQPDGSFVMSSFSPEDGATVGPQKVRINCYSSQSPAAQSKPVVGERSIGALLIPRKYTSFDTSGFTAEVKAEGNEPFEFRLTGPPLKLPK